MQTSNTDKQNKGEQNILSDIWYRYFPYWPLFIVLLIFAVTGTWFYLRQTVPLYESAATILIKDEKRGLDDSKMLASLDLLSTKKIIENETEVLRSRSLMSQVVKKLSLYAPVFREGRLVSPSAYVSSPIKIEALTPDLLPAVNKIYFSFDAANRQVDIQGKRYKMDEWVQTPYGALRFLPNKYVYLPLPGRMYFSLAPPATIAPSLTKRVEVSAASKVSTVIYLTIKDEVPQRGEDILNELVRVYDTATIVDKNSLAANTLAFVEDRLSYVSHQLDSIEYKVQQYKSNKGAVDISTQGKMFLQNVGENDQKLGEINMQLAALSQVEGYVLSKDNKAGIVPSTLGIRDEMLSQLLDKLYSSELEYEKLRKTTPENNPLMVSLSDQINKIKPGIMENINTRRAGLEASKANLYSTNGSYTTILQGIPKKERELLEISRSQSIMSGLYTFLLQKREEAALSHSSTVADSRIIDKAASSPFPVSPNKKLFYLVAAMGAFILSVVFLGAKEIFNPTILFRREIENFTSSPILGEIAFEKLKDPIVIGKPENRFIAEQFRRLRAALPHIGISAKRKKIMVTSTISGEGKSFVSLNLALSLAMADKKVVLVEFDLSNPTLSDKLVQYHEKGLSEYLQGEAEPEEIIRRTEANENLFFISSGKLPANPSELIMGERTSDILSYLDGIFDYVIIDTAPAGPSSDAYTLSPLCDVTLYIIRHKYTPRIVVQRMDENNKITNLKNIAIIFNGIRSRGFRKNNYGYGYGYGYGHNYYAARESKYAKATR